MSDLSSRPATPADAETILAVGVARDIADLGVPDWSLDDVREELAAADHAWVVEDGGRVVAAALLEGAHARVLVHPDAEGRGLGTQLRETVEGAAAPGTLLMQQVSGSNDTARALLEAAGYRAEHHYWSMAVVLAEGGLDAPVWSPEVSPRGYEPGHEDAVHMLVEEAFSEIPGNVPSSFEEWRASSVGRAGFAPDLSTLVFAADGSLAGLVLCERREEGHGFVTYLATARAWRGRGLGRALLVDALAKMHAAGLVRGGLSVNGRNRSATALYESVGMTVESHADRYDKRLAA